MTTQRVRTGLRIPFELNTELIMTARKNGISKNALILQILWDWMDKKEKERLLSEEGEKEVG